MGEILNLIESVSGGFPSYFFNSYLYIRVDCTNGLYSLKGRKHVRNCETAEGVRTISGLYKCCRPSMLCITIEWA